MATTLESARRPPTPVHPRPPRPGAVARGVLPLGRRQEVGHGGHRARAHRLRVRPRPRQPEGVLRRRGLQPLRRVPPRASSCRFLPRTVFLWLLRIGLIARLRPPHPLRLLAHPHEPAGPGRRLRAGPRLAGRRLRQPHDALDGRDRRLFLIFHLADLTWGTANPDFVRGDVYRNFVATFSRPPVAIIYIVANIALGHPPLPRRLVDVPEPRAQQPEVEQVAPGLRHRARRAHHRR